MTTLETRLQDDLKAATKSRDKARLGTIRHLLSQLQYAKLQAGDTWSEEAALDVVAAAAKMRRESIEQFGKGNRPDLVAKEREELAVVESYLPRQLSETEIDTLVAEAIGSTGANSVKDLGKVMAVLMPKVRGRADGKLVNARVRARLA